MAQAFRETGKQYASQQGADCLASEHEHGLLLYRPKWRTEWYLNCFGQAVCSSPLSSLPCIGTRASQIETGFENTTRICVKKMTMAQWDQPCEAHSLICLLKHSRVQQWTDSKLRLKYFCIFCKNQDASLIPLLCVKQGGGHGIKSNLQNAGPNQVHPLSRMFTALQRLRRIYVSSSRATIPSPTYPTPVFFLWLFFFLLLC